MNKRYEKKEQENDFEYGLRLIKIKNEEKPEDLEWSDVVELLHLDIHKDTLRKAASATPFSGYSVMKYYEEKINNKTITEKSNELYELEQMKIQIRDERNELNKKLRNLSRTQNLIDIFKGIITEDVKPIFDFKPHDISYGDNDLLVMLSDLHYGIKCDNFHNTYDPDIAKDRLEKYLSEIIHIKEVNKSDSCYLFLGGDLISGMIHTTIRIENAENVVNQIRQVSVLLSHFVYDLSRHFNTVEVYHCPGNHSRLFKKKEDNQKGDYLDILIPVYMQAALQNIQNVFIHTDNPYDEEICTFTVRGHSIVGVHGHHDQLSTVLNTTTKFLRFIPELILMGHRHSNGLTTVDRTKVVECGSLSGMDSYCIEQRIVGVPEQVVLSISERKLISGFYDIQL